MHSTILFVLLTVGAYALPLEPNSPHRSIVPESDKNTYLWRIYAGTPRRAHDVVISTASVNTFLAAKGFESGTPNLRLYDPESSSTAKMTNPAYFAEEKNALILGSTFEDIIQFKKQNITLEFGAVTHLINQDKMGVDGHIGLSWAPYEKATPSKTSPIIHTLLADQKEKVYHVYTAPGPKRIKFGGENFCKGETPLFHPIMEGKKIPMVTLTEFELNDYHAVVEYPVIVDSSSPTLQFIRPFYSAIIKQYSAKFDRKLNQLIVDCNGKEHNWKFVIDGKTSLTLNDNNLVNRIGNTNKCALMVSLYDDDVETFTLGTPFLYDYCVSFDVANNKIAFVKAPEAPPEE